MTEDKRDERCRMLADQIIDLEDANRRAVKKDPSDERYFDMSLPHDNELADLCKGRAKSSTDYLNDARRGRGRGPRPIVPGMETPDDTLPAVIAQYLQTTAGQIMLEGATYFRWDVQQAKVISSGNSPNPVKNPTPGVMGFFRIDGRWRRFD